MAQPFALHQDHIKQLVDSALASAEPAAAVRRYLRRVGRRLSVGTASYKLDCGRVFLISVGKASLGMASAAAEILEDYLAAGIVISKHGESSPEGDPSTVNELPQNLRAYTAGHPIPDQQGVAATADVISLLKSTVDDDLVLCLISGGSSAMLTQPRLPLAHWQQVVDALLASGCTINELNAVRKQLDEVKGGGLARLAAPARCASLILSDVIGNPLDVIGSGPTVPNPDQPTRAWDVLRRYNIQARIDSSVWQALERELAERERDSVAVGFEAQNVIVGDIRTAARAVVKAGQALGFSSQLLTTHLEGEAREVGRVAAALAKDAKPNSCLVMGGETTVTVRGKGLGGRNLELALAAGVALDGTARVALASFATDGDDGLTSAAGATVTGQTVSSARAKGLDPLEFLHRNDSYRFFSQQGGLIETGPTGTNVNDLVIILKY